jgi:hypothetical protein
LFVPHGKEHGRATSSFPLRRVPWKRKHGKDQKNHVTIFVFAGCFFISYTANKKGRHVIAIFCRVLPSTGHGKVTWEGYVNPSSPGTVAWARQSIFTGCFFLEHTAKVSSPGVFS